jgi:hypothetical protein
MKSLNLPNQKIDEAHGINILSKLNVVDNLNFDRLKWKLRETGEYEAEALEFAEVEYKRFLKLLLLFPKEILVPSKAMDLFWHEHILDTRNYVKDTGQIFGRYLHHNPYFGGDKLEHEVWEETYNKTKRLYQQTYNQFMDGLKQQCAGDNGDDGSCFAGTSDE